MRHVTLKVMDATAMELPENSFDKAVATYTISAVPDPLGVLREMRRVVRPGGILVILNHFRSDRAFRHIEDFMAPICTRLGWKSNLEMTPLLEQVGLTPEVVIKVNLFNGWRLVKCVNRK
jgi:phosphatidylethanolamine/phosphatidyl-N-methylethanolamine N-methyltransferase